MECTVDNCPNKEIIKDHEERIRNQESKEVDIAKMEKDIGFIVKTVTVLEANDESMIKEMNELKMKPAKRWDKLVWIVVGTVITGIISGVLVTLATVMTTLIDKVG